jgi:predicted transcriptional regulator
MEFVWSAGVEVTVRDVAGVLPEYAYTTVATVLDRLVLKGVLRCRTVDRAKRYAAVGSSGTHTAVLMYEALCAASDPDTALRRFAENLDRAEASVLREALRESRGRPDRTH